jgi:hypothetical protein
LKDAADKLVQHADNENFRTLCHAIRLALNSVMTRLKQKYDQTSAMTNNSTLNENIEEFDKSLVQFTGMLLASA